MARRWPRHHDVCRWLVLLDCVAELVTFVAFLLAYETQRQFMVSDTLFALPAVMVVIDDIKRAVHRLWTGRSQADAAPTAAAAAEGFRS
jgi:hypothetical protein